MDVLFGLEFTIFSNPFSVTGSKKNDVVEGSFIVSKIDPFIFLIFLASFGPTLTKKHSLWNY